MVPAVNCECSERYETKINSYNLFEEVREFFLIAKKALPRKAFCIVAARLIKMPKPLEGFVLPAPLHHVLHHITPIIFRCPSLFSQW